MAILLNPRVWIAVALAAALAFGGVFTYRAGKASVRVEFDKYKLEQAAQTVKAEVAARAEETRRQGAVDKEAQDAQIKIAALENDARASRDSADRLRIAVNAAVSRARKDASATTPSTGQPDSDPIGVLAYVLGRSSARSEIVERYADENRIAAVTCERTADALRAPLGR